MKKTLKKKIEETLTCIDCCGVVSWVVRADSQARVFVFHLEIGQFLLVLYWSETGLGDLATGVDFGRGGLGLEGGVGPALGLVAVGPANKEMLGICLSQHSDIILTLVLKKNKIL